MAGNIKQDWPLTPILAIAVNMRDGCFRLQILLFVQSDHKLARWLTGDGCLPPRLRTCV